jgi:hypothetical protein
MDLISAGVLRCRVPPRPPGRVPFYISVFGGGKRPASDVRTFEFREVRRCRLALSNPR